MLHIKDLNVYYGNIQALKGVTLDIEEGEIVTLIGANGAGKSTLLKTLSGLIKPKKGSIEYLGKSVAGKPAQSIVKAGMSHVPEGRRVFSNMTVEENLELGAFLRKDKQEIQKNLQKVYEIFPRLFERKKQLAGTLSGGEQQMLAMGRAIMAKPKLLLLDEPSMGLAPIIVRTIFQVIQEINEEGTTVLLVEQNAHMALSIAHRGYVIETGKVVLSGSAQELQESDELKQAYLGGH
ncbi:ABC transporter ATP-binding protein [Niallia alba]|uniref:ABC transporter ATP-binding protein n=1 Tax=Niallia circulans TaxID=1397 RepID=A0A941JKP3_NIACI|nr:MULTISPECIES: ABC transporter ATP-binding protein [Niallia]MCB5236424.1 ABC transporter ATP-binding protein [Niallia circulans]MDU1847858.1 ABC transporter ATP-binding protein [Niallia nealsonii]MED3794043.1 ABC transporter ATP-binding protein [Niallia alba]